MALVKDGVLTGSLFNGTTGTTWPAFVPFSAGTSTLTGCVSTLVAPGDVLGFAAAFLAAGGLLAFGT